MFNMREYGQYSLEIPLKEDKDVKLTDDPPSIKKIEGVYILEYIIAKKATPISIESDNKL